MANRLKGITLEIGGDTTSLSKSLSGVNHEIKTTQDQLKDVQKLLKLDPTNVDLLKQKQKLLTDQIKNTNDKLKELKQAQEAMDAKGVDKASDQYLNLQREIIDCEQSLKGLEKAAAESNVTLQQVAAVGEKFKEAGTQIEEAGKKISKVSLAVAGVGTAAVVTTANFDESMSKVSAISGATGEDFDALRNKAREMGAETKFSASEAADAMTYMAMAGWKTEDMLSGIDGVLNLAAASGEGLATTADIVTDALTAFGMTAADSAHFADVLAAASSNANTNVSMMGETFKYTAPVAGALGFSAESVAEAIGLMANSGIKASQAGTSLRTILTAMSGDIELAGKNIGEVTIATTDANGQMRDLSSILDDLRYYFSQLSESEAASAAQAIAGKNAMSGFLALVQAAPGDVAKLRDAIGAADGTAKQMADTMQNNLNGQIEILKSKLAELAISIGDILMPFLMKIVSAIQSFVDWLNNASPAVKSIVVVIGLLVAAAGPLLVIVGKVLFSIGQIMTYAPQIGALLSGFAAKIPALISGIGGIVSTISGGLMSALTSVAGFFAANPIVLGIIAIGAAIAAVAVLVAKNWDVIKEGAAICFEEIKEAAKSSLDTLKADIMTIVDAFKEAGRIMFDAWAGLFSALGQLFTSIGEGIKSAFNSVISWVMSGLNSVMNAIRSVASAVAGLFGGGGGSRSGGGIPMFANGGTLRSGSAIVGEAGPELLTVAGGRATVTPMTATIDSKSMAALSGASGGTQVVDVNVSFTGSLSQLARLLQPEIVAETSRRGPSLVSR